jgi:PEP-CTERM motif
MRFRFSSLAALGAALLFASQALAQTATFDFESPVAYPGANPLQAPDQGWGSGFDGDQNGGGRTLPIVVDGSPGNGTNYARVTRTGPGSGFQQTAYQTGNPSDPFYIVMAAGVGDAANTFLDYDWYVDTSLIQAGAGTFFQGGSYVNTGSGYFAQHFPGSGKEIELNGTQLASGQVFSGHVHISFQAAGFAIPTGETFYRLGLIENGDGSAQYADYDNITITHAVPEPSTFVLGGLAGLGLMVYRRRK